MRFLQISDLLVIAPATLIEPKAPEKTGALQKLRLFQARLSLA